MGRVSSLTIYVAHYLKGWSFGGVVAYEIARILGPSIISGLLLIDTPSPMHHVPLSDSLIDAAMAKGGGASSEVGVMVRDQFRMNARALGAYCQGLSLNDERPSEFNTVLLRSREPFKVSHNEHQEVEIPAWLGDPSSRTSEAVAAAWAKVLGRVKVLDIPGNHFEAFQSRNVSVFYSLYIPY